MPFNNSFLKRKVTFVKNIFEFVGGLFVKVLDFTRAGSEFLLGGMMNVDNFAGHSGAEISGENLHITS